MTEPHLKIGYYSIYKIPIDKSKVKYVVDSGKTLYLAKYRKFIINPYRDVKEFPTLAKAKEYIKVKLKKGNKEKKKRFDKIPKSLYLVLIKEKISGLTFVKVGFTSKRFIARRFSKIYGYEGYTLETILRRVETPDAVKLEKAIKDAFNKKRSIKKYRPLLESFSGYSECYNLICLDEIIEIFDKLTKKT